MADDVFGIVGTTQAGNFHIEKVVAEGGFGVVYRALHGGFRAPVALKCLKVSEARTPKERELFLEKFREEAQLLFRLSASIPEVVRPLHIDVLHLKNGQFVPFLAMEWLEGEALDRLIDRRRMQGEAPMALQKLMKLFRPIAHAIARAHHFSGADGTTISVIHRDLKPENIFIVTHDGVDRARILDFGIAQARSLAEQAVGKVTSSDQLNAFSPAYAAPEQWVPKRYGQAGPWTDVWGLALTMVETLVGHQIIDGETQAMMGTALDPERRPTPRAEGCNVAADVDAVFERALAVNPRDRTKDIETFWTELESALGFSPSFGNRPSDDGYGPLSVPPPSAPASAARPQIKQRADVWLEMPDAPVGLELDVEPSSLRSRAPLSIRPPTPELELPGVELDLPQSDPMPRSHRVDPAGDQAWGASSALAPRTRELSTPPPLDAEIDAPPRTARGSLPPPASGRISLAPISTRQAPLSVPPGALPSADATSQLPQGHPALRPPRPVHNVIPQRPPLAVPPPGPNQLRRVGVAIAAIALATVLIVVDVIMKTSGDDASASAGLMLGPLRAFWVAGALFVVGAGIFFWRLLGDQEG
ncbi:serine/threonine protein kinase [Chondromyces apiculatus]|uniref:Serine/threonine protein kinase n=1 Tax=Chondromyces apiculatus DSM 436 TaxID=1192034 RepID=A0A017TGA6_9BACT|nr:protein kinase [Chondromyces apiculatus]EYF07606.1 Serine/threonine protein kinase [Chondromyces apiculatus DSM 436]